MAPFFRPLDIYPNIVAKPCASAILLQCTFIIIKACNAGRVDITG